MQHVVNHPSPYTAPQPRWSQTFGRKRFFFFLDVVHLHTHTHTINQSSWTEFSNTDNRWVNYQSQSSTQRFYRRQTESCSSERCCHRRCCISLMDSVCVPTTNGHFLHDLIQSRLSSLLKFFLKIQRLHLVTKPGYTNILN